MQSILEVNKYGIYCPQGDFYIDPWRAVERAIITHGHSDHARRGSASYLAHHLTVPVLRHRLGKNIRVEGAAYGETIYMNGVSVSLHPAAHIPGSAQIRIEYKGEVWVVTGDYKCTQDPLAGTFEPLRCNTLLTESTFGLPVYSWPDEAGVIEDIHRWWRTNASASIPSVLLGYSLGKSQRILNALDISTGPVYVQSAIEEINSLFRAEGLFIPETRILQNDMKIGELSRALILMTPGSPDIQRLRTETGCSIGNVSGWMAVRRKGFAQWLDRRFILSDHADWQGLLDTVRGSGAERILVTHGYAAELCRYLNGIGYNASPLETLFGSEEEATGVKS